MVLVFKASDFYNKASNSVIYLTQNGAHKLSTYILILGLQKTIKLATFLYKTYLGNDGVEIRVDTNR